MLTLPNCSNYIYVRGSQIFELCRLKWCCNIKNNETSLALCTSSQPLFLPPTYHSSRVMWTLARLGGLLRPRPRQIQQQKRVWFFGASSSNFIFWMYFPGKFHRINIFFHFSCSKSEAELVAKSFHISASSCFGPAGLLSLSTVCCNKKNYGTTLHECFSCFCSIIGSSRICRRWTLCRATSFKGFFSRFYYAYFLYILKCLRKKIKAEWEKIMLSHRDAF